MNEPFRYIKSAQLALIYERIYKLLAVPYFWSIANRFACGEVGESLHFATSCPLTVSSHMTKPSDHLTEHWWKSCLSNKYSRSKIIQLVLPIMLLIVIPTTLTDNEGLFKLDRGIESNFSDSDSDIEVAIPQ
ncbi:hypothetical protein AVEN_45393-1 [Araneus ventricosus]|uniref:Uncharacterized protein n=1 Tax=Araneus ventricosus TaxID=182803 RepID=A0A4Y2A2Z3_ARAVE|nr:hypothetical protein AVEN_45393-1 [Araneus ventricosus]